MGGGRGHVFYKVLSDYSTKKKAVRLIKRRIQLACRDGSTIWTNSDTLAMFFFVNIPVILL